MISQGWWTCWVLWQMQDLKVKFRDWSPTFPSHTAQWVIRCPVEYLEALNQYFDQATNFLANIPSNRLSENLKYAELLTAHIRLEFIDIALSDKSPPQTYREQVEKYFLALSSIIQECGTDERLTVDAWVMMMFRAFCWGACHFFVPGEKVPRAYFGSQLPVYIA
jgi:hypothetical protein